MGGSERGESKRAKEKNENKESGRNKEKRDKRGGVRKRVCGQEDRAKEDKVRDRQTEIECERMTQKERESERGQGERQTDRN